MNERMVFYKYLSNLKLVKNTLKTLKYYRYLVLPNCFESLHLLLISLYRTVDV